VARYCPVVSHSVPPLRVPRVVTDGERVERPVPPNLSRQKALKAAVGGCHELVGSEDHRVLHDFGWDRPVLVGRCNYARRTGGPSALIFIARSL
jgi:hypothetical protein